MNRELSEHEALAALLEGELTDAERADAMRRILESPERYETLVEAMRTLDDLEGRAAGTGVHPSGRGKAVRRAGFGIRDGWKWGALAAVLAGIAVIPFIRGGAGGGGIPAFTGYWEPPGTTLAGGTPIAAALGAGWDSPGWLVERGAGPALQPQRAFRLGTRLSQLHLALVVGDSLETRVARLRIAEIAAEVEGGGVVPAVVDAWVAAAADGVPERLEATRDESIRAVRGLFASQYLDLGLWTETVRQALLAGAEADLYEGSALDDLRSIRSSLPRSPTPHPAEAEILQTLARIDAAWGAAPGTPGHRQLREALAALNATTG